MKFALVFEGPSGPIMRQHGPAIRAALDATAAETAATIQSRGRGNIQGAGNFGPRWTDAFKSTVLRDQGGLVIKTTFRGRGWRKFQYGQTIRGRPLLWIPFSFSNAKGMRMSKFPGELVRVDRPGGKAPMMLSTADGQPKYFGKESVSIPKKFNLVEISQEEAREMPNRFRQHLQRS